ncbi:DUF1330 domain-containing protein [Nocardia jinanensis]|uniref:DUF1330 domain-containing protein n=1 Tax=Nocardia jinanensis TaxID=382504 RepID=A0A917VLK5_9NOCA|nr:DUF1330 domain-containing protein [Nocardia jinanensis]GGK93248.1 hypothetical protein GCM10011588_04740 [Nocardia jinanensis]
MPAYVIANVEVLDEEASWAYAPVAQQSILDHGGRYLVAGPTSDTVEGSWDLPRLLIIEFPDMDRIRQWYDSPEYRRARRIREGKMRIRLLFTEGTPPEGFTLPT